MAVRAVSMDNGRSRQQAAEGLAALQAVFHNPYPDAVFEKLFSQVIADRSASDNHYRLYWLDRKGKMLKKAVYLLF